MEEALSYFTVTGERWEGEQCRESQDENSSSLNQAEGQQHNNRIFLLERGKTQHQGVYRG